MKRIVIFLFVLMLCGCNSRAGENEIRGFAMDAPYSIKTQKLTSETETKIRNYMQSTDRIFSAYLETSYLSQLNREKNMFFSDEDTERKELYRLVASVLPYCNEVFDISVRPVSKLWNFTAEQSELPDEELLKQNLQFVGFENILMNGNTIQLNHQTELELGAVAKGYVCDVVSEMLQGTESIVDIGGTVRAVGKEITAGIKAPGRDGLLCSFVLPEGKAVSTSGSYERNFTQNGVFYHHILNPTSGYPAETDIVSVTVISDSALLSDILSTTYFAQKNPQIPENVEAIFVTKENQIYTTNGIKNLKLLNDNYKLMNNSME